ncbi:M48 family metallopeptidase [Rubritalea marina]|uniref:M48 family metallopeptidase n=1 Tax=Rubritalea marina TaxID=361055 RepID=UPI0003797777|nr:M48 family metallopeptidase [Rubritalea marina]
MNFYEAQDHARRRTKLLVFYFILAVIGVVGAIYAILGFYYTTQTVRVVDDNGSVVEQAGEFWDPERFATVSLLTVGVILAGNLFKSMQLRGGGSVVARDMGGRQIDPHTSDADERKLMNVVEEMAIASGVPVPEVWVMDQEMGINAFAAGTEINNAVIGVTRGCIQQLNRSELQGVIAHEFSHILNGDMKLNMRLIGWLFGIMMLTIIGRELLWHMQLMSLGRRRSENNNGALIGLVVAIALLVVGAIGVFFARMIQAAISRQREYLADASAVQFTRDPSGISGALRKIGGMSSGVKSGKASEASHMFFADGGMFSYGFATHPPLEVRLKAIEGAEYELNQATVTETQGAQQTQAPYSGLDAQVSGFAGGTQGAMEAQPPPVPASVTRLQWDQLGETEQTSSAVGADILASLKSEWIEAAHDRTSAQALIFGLLLGHDARLLDKGEKYLKKQFNASTAEAAKWWSESLADEHSTQKIALIDLSVPALRKLSQPETEKFVRATEWLIASDGKVDIFEFMLQKLLAQHLGSAFGGGNSTRVRFTKITQLQRELHVLVSTMAGIGAQSGGDLESAYSEATGDLRQKGLSLPAILAPEECGLHLVDEALQKLAQATPLIHRDALHACGLAVMADGEIGNTEIELLRAAADAMGTAIPPFVKVA